MMRFTYYSAGSVWLVVTRERGYTRVVAQCDHGWEAARLCAKMNGA